MNLFRAKQLNALAHVCPNLQSNVEHMDTNELIYEIIEDMAPNLGYVVQECRWQQKKINCSEYITPILTSEGLCFTFNALNPYDIYTDK